VKGSGHGGQQQQRQQALGEEEDFAVHASVYGKLQVGPSVDPNDQEQEKGRERCLCLPELGCVYLCRLCTCVSVSLARGEVVSTPPHYDIEQEVASRQLD
jgi:hypothetical protein